MAIVDQGGRYQSIRTEEEIRQMFRDDWDQLDPDEREAVTEILKEIRVRGQSNALELASKAIYVRQPVSMERFLGDEYFLGGYGATLFPKIREDLIEMFSGRYTEALIGGSIGAVS